MRLVDEEDVLKFRSVSVIDGLKLCVVFVKISNADDGGKFLSAFVRVGDQENG